MRIVALFMALALASGPLLAAPPADEGYTSENNSKGVKPPKTPPPPVDRTQGKDKEDKKDSKKEDKKKDDGKAISADEVEKLKKMEDKEAVVFGKVTEVFVSKNKTVAILNFGTDRKNRFCAVIFPKNWDKWDKGSEKGVEIIKGYKGKTVEVSGKIGIHEELPQIIVNVPSQIKVK